MKNSIPLSISSILLLSIMALADWPNVGYDQTNSRYVNVSVPLNPVLKWNFTAMQGILSSPAVAGDIVVVGSEDDRVYFINFTTGTQMANYTTGDNVTSSPTISGDSVFVGSRDNRLYAFNLSTGEPLWNYTTGDDVGSSPKIHDSIAYVGSYDGKVYALNASTGNLLWDYTTGDQVWSTPAIAGELLFIGSNDGNMYALNISNNGSKVWNYTTGGWIISSPTAYNNIVLFGSYDANIYALNATTGAKIWNRTVGNQIFASGSTSNNVYFIGCLDGRAYAINISDGTVLWNYTTGNQVMSSVSSTDDVVIFGSLDNQVYMVNRTNGQHIWNYTAVGGVFSSPAISGNVILAASPGGTLYAFEPPTPTIQNITVSNITNTTATVSWITDELTRSTVEYGMTTNYSSTLINSSYLADHIFQLANLTPGAAYHFRVNSTTSFDKTTSSADQNFTTDVIHSESADFTAGSTVRVNASELNVTLDVTSNTTVSNATVTIVASYDNPTSASLSARNIGKYIQIQVPDELEGNLSYATLTLYYTDAELSATSLDESTLGIYWSNGSTDWEAVNPNLDWVYSTGINETLNYASANMSHFSYFIIGTLQEEMAIGLTLGWNLVSLPLEI